MSSGEGVSQADLAEEKAKKKRTTNPGVRVQGGRIYDSESGTTCHQCRQKTVEVKAKCTECTLYWCPRCLLNRYGQVVEEVAKLAKWPCPRCQGTCNCSNCRKKRGLEATGILANVCKTAGFGSVSALLDKNPAAKRAILDIPKAPKAAKASNKRKHQAEADLNLLPDNELGDRERPFPDGESVCIHFAKDSKRVRGVTKPKGYKASCPLPRGCNPGDLAEVLEFVHVFEEQLGLKTLDLGLLAAEIVQPATPLNPFADEHASPAGKLHVRLLDMVRNDWGLKGTVGVPGWQTTMRQYLKQDIDQATTLLGRPPGISPSERTYAEGGSIKDADEPSEEKEKDEADEADNLPEYPDGGYWSLNPASRLRMLWSLMQDALATAPIRDAMDALLMESAANQKEAKEEQAAARKKAREAQQEEQNKRLAALISGNGGLTLEEQREAMMAARASAASEIAEMSQAPTVTGPCLRVEALGQDREKHMVWALSGASAVLTGKKEGLLVSKPWHSVKADSWKAHHNAADIAGALDRKGILESRLLQKLEALFQTSNTGSPAKAIKGGKGRKIAQGKVSKCSPLPAAKHEAKPIQVAGQ